METTLIIKSVRHLPDKGGFFFGESSIGPVTGTAEFVSTGVKVLATGEWKKHSTYGRQFRIASFRYATPTDSLQALFGSGFLKGIKGGKAASVVKTLGDRAFEVLDAATYHEKNRVEWNGISLLPGQILIKIHGVGPVVAKQMVSDWKERGAWAKAAMLCVTAGLALKQARKAHQHFGTRLEETIVQYPYRLSVVRGINWDRCDAIAKMGWPGKQPIIHDCAMRYAAAVREALRIQHGRGHMAYPKNEAIKAAVNLAKPALDLWPLVSLALEEETEEGILESEKYLALTIHAVTEILSASALVALQKRPRLMYQWDMPKMKFDLSDDQTKAIKLALSSPLCVITGGPGTGKTTIVAAILDVLDDLGLTYSLCAPTGKAARRMVDTTGREASTIHRLLGLPRKLNRVETDWLIVDESSMLDAELFRTLLRAVGDRTNVIFVGDVDQLPPVGAGEPFFQMIQAGVPTSRLTVIHRQGEGSGIVAAAHAIKNGQTPQVADDFKLHVAGGNSALKPLLVRWLPQIMAKYDLALENLQIMTPVNGNDWGRISVNKALKQLLNPGGTEIGGTTWRVGDKVIHLKNNYDLDVMNGQVGIVVWVDQELWKKSEPVDVFSEHSSGPREGNSYVVVVSYDGTQVGYRPGDLEELAHAFCLTVHKMQGDECDAAIILMPLVGYEDFMLRQLPYTAITRAKKYVLVITANSALDRYIANEARVRRYTRLGEIYLEMKEASEC